MYAPREVQLAAGSVLILPLRTLAECLPLTSTVVGIIVKLAISCATWLARSRV
jgi:hypothetical protein